MAATHEHIIERLALSMLPGMDTQVCDRILEAYPSPVDFLEGTQSELKARGCFPKGMLDSQVRHQAVERAKREIEFLEKTSIRVLWYQDRDYPRNILKASRAPIVIYTIGDTDLNNSRIVGIVGTRHATAYGNNFTEKLVKEIKETIENPVIISGLAYGIDIAAHRAALKNDIPTLGIVGHGLDKIYPAVHRDTAARMVRRGGMILSDYPHDAPVNKYNFLARNRLIAALSDALVVVESGERGGALATARLAVKSGTPVFALPGRITDTYSLGCNGLISDGIARPISCAENIVKQLGWPVMDRRFSRIDPLDNLTTQEKAMLLSIMTIPQCDNDTLVATHGLTAATVMTLMIGLEMRGIVTAIPGNCYEINIAVDPETLSNAIDHQSV